MAYLGAYICVRTPCDVRMYGARTRYGVPGSCRTWELLLLLLLLHLFGAETKAGTQNKLKNRQRSSLTPLGV